MKALSIRQPWCHRILHEGKDVENRDWRTHFRGWFLIHASKGVDAGDRDEVKAKEMPLGGIVGMAEIVDCVTSMDSPWFFGRFGFVLRNVRPLPFIQCNGSLSFFKPDITDAVASLWHKDELSEGQGAKILSVDRLAFRKICDERQMSDNQKGGDA